jgi:ABC-type hemin transport system ATPase subunit
MFELSNVSVEIGNKKLLDGITCTFRPNQITAILGANGAGKSTLFKSLLGEYPLETGGVIFAGKSILSYTLAELSKHRAYIAQAKISMFSMPVFEYLALARIQYIESNKHSHNLVLEVSTTFEVTHLLMRDISQLSGGEWQLVEFVRAYLQLYEESNMQGKCLLLDEPASALDIKQTKIFYGHLKIFQQNGGTAILIDHSINAVADLASDIVLVKYGKILAQGPKQQIFSETLLNDCYETQGQLLQHSQQSTAVYHVDC